MLVETRFLDIRTKKIITDAVHMDCVKRVGDSGTIRYYHPITNLPHREDGPAVVYPSGTQEWWINGKKHRTDSPAVERHDGLKEWWLNGKLHREDGPAIISPSGSEYWYLNGKQHRLDGPAVRYMPFNTLEYWVDDINYSYNEWLVNVQRLTGA